MPNWFVFNSDRSPEDIALESPDEAEEVDLKRHATRCALRYRSLKNGLNSQGDRLRRIEVFILLVGGWLVLTSPQFHDLLKSFLGLP